MKSIPIRTCIGCNESKPKKDLIRIVKQDESTIFIDLSGKQNGRGAYICRDSECLKKAIKSRRLSRAFSMAIGDELYDKLKEEIETDSKA